MTNLGRIIDPFCWNYGDLPNHADEIVLATRRGQAMNKAKATLKAVMEKLDG